MAHLSFRQRLTHLADEHEELQRSFDALSAECDDLRTQLAAVIPEAEQIDELNSRDDPLLLEAKQETKFDDDEVVGKLPGGRDLLDPDPSMSPLRLWRSPGRDVEDDRAPLKAPVSAPPLDTRKEEAPSQAPPVQYESPSRKDGIARGASRSSSGSRSYSASSASRSAGARSAGSNKGGVRRRRRKRRGGPRGTVGRRDREWRNRHRSKSRGHGPRSRGRSCRRSRSRGRASRSNSRRRRIGAIGAYGTGDHRMDLDTFISKNKLEARVAHALRTMNTEHQKKVMGTDGGENSFMLIDRVKSPNAVVMSRVRKLETGPGTRPA